MTTMTNQKECEPDHSCAREDVTSSCCNAPIVFRDNACWCEKCSSRLHGNPPPQEAQGGWEEAILWLASSIWADTGNPPSKSGRLQELTAFIRSLIAQELAAQRDSIRKQVEEELTADEDIGPTEFPKTDDEFLDTLNLQERSIKHRILHILSPEAEANK